MTEKNNHLGDDPLAWLSAGTVEPKVSVPQTPSREEVKKVEPMPTSLKSKTDTELVEDSFALIAKKGREIVADFYLYLFDNYPELAPMFEGVSKTGQQKKLLAALVLLVDHLRQPDMLEEYLKELGERHQSYGVQEADYDKVVYSLLTALKKHSGPHWLPEVERAWIKTLTAVKEIMTSAYITITDEDDSVVSQSADIDRFSSPAPPVRETSVIQPDVEIKAQPTVDEQPSTGQGPDRIELIDKALDELTAIDLTSKKIAENIELMDDIAFQTDLMALNATVEAARAGNEGRAIAVIAAEIRSLSQRSAAAVKEIKQLLNENDERLRLGAESINDYQSLAKTIRQDK